jgi:conjugal transfer pilus assembly protein TraB
MGLFGKKLPMPKRKNLSDCSGAAMKPQNVLRNQKKLFGAIIFGFLFLSLGFGYLLIGDRKYAPTTLSKQSVDLPADKLNPQDIWMSRVESQSTLLDQKVKYLEELVLETKKQEEGAEKEKKQLKQEIARLKNELTAVKQNPPPPPLPLDPFIAAPLEAPPPLLPICAPLAEFSMDEEPPIIKNVEEAIPSGTSVKALLVSSVDADCAVFSINNPIPVKLRILDDGHLPKDIAVKLKGGIIIGSAYGNLSSERVYMRLERLTQVNRDGDFVETEIAGYVTGEDGKYGVRGTVVDKSAKIMANAAMSGLFAEGSQILQAAVGRYRIGNYLNANTSQAVGESFMPGAVGGTCNAFDMLADYYIRRAEQVEPVIQVNAGRIVDVTFTHGVEIGELHTKEKIREVRERCR